MRIIETPVIARWIWIEVRWRFGIAVVAVVAVSAVGIASLPGFYSIREWGPNFTQIAARSSDFAASAAQWQSDIIAKLIYACVVSWLATSGISSYRGTGLDYPQGLPVSGRRWIREQRRLVLLLATVLAVVSHLSLAIFG